MKYSIPNRIIGFLLLPGLLMIVGVWQLSLLFSRFRVWVREHVLG